MTKDTRPAPRGPPPHPGSHQSLPDAEYDDDSTSVSSQQIRKRDRFFNLFRSSNTEPKVKDLQSMPPKSTVKESLATSTKKSIPRPSIGDTKDSVNIDHTISSIADRTPPSNIQSPTLLKKPRLNFFSQNVKAPAVDISLPEFGARIDTTPQLALSIGLLAKDHDTVHKEDISPQNTSPGTAAYPLWLKAMSQDPTEQDRLLWLGTRMVDEFTADASKDSIEIAEMVLIGPVLDKEHYRRLLSCIITAFDQSVLLDVDLLQGIVQLIQSSPRDFLVSDDLIKILHLFRLRLQSTHQQSSAHPYHLTLAVSRVLDVMADHRVKDLSRVEEHEPLSGVLSSLKGSSDPYLMYQACYAFQALQYVPDDETTLQAVLRQSSGVVDGLVKISAVIKLDLVAVLEGLDKLQELLVSAAKVAGTVYEGVSSLMESGRGVLESLKEGYGSGKKRPWYAAIRAANALAQTGQLQDLNRLICEAPCRRDPLFQWGICQLLGEIASDAIWDAVVRQQAIETLGDLYRNDPEWVQDESVRSWMLNIIGQLSSIDDRAVSTRALTLLKELQHDQVTAAAIRLPYPLRNRLPLPTSSPVLVRVQKIPLIEYDLHRLQVLQLRHSHQAVFIPPMAKPSLKAKDDDIFSLMEKTQEFLASGREVMLVLGDSGAGKSTFNRHLEHHLWTDYKQGDPIPLFINLPAIDRPDQDLIAKQLKILSFSEDQIMEIKLHRQLILICDGYDESQQLVNLHRTNFLNQPGQWNTKMVISCRTQFLGPDYQSRFAPQGEGGHYDRPALNLFQEAVIAPFTKAQIENYVEQYVPLEPRTWRTQDYMDRLITIPNLLDLVRNPFLLSLSLEALPGVTEGKQDVSTINITRVQLYDTFVTHWLDVNKRRLERNNALSTDDRDMLNQMVNAGFTTLGLDFSTRLARAIFDQQDGKPVVKYVHLSDKNTWKAEFFGSQPEVRLLRESSPLARAGNQFRFVHRSMQEYFLSRAIYNPVSVDDEHDQETDNESSELQGSSLLDVDGPLFRKNLIGEPSIIRFLCDRVKSNPDFEQQLRAVIDLSKIDSDAVIAATNAITILVRAGVSFHGANLCEVKIPDADLSEGQFDSVQFQGADLSGVNLSRSWLRQVDLTNALLEGVQFGELPYLETECSAVSCAYSPDGQMIGVGLETDGFAIFRTASWRKITCIRGIKRVRGIAFSPDSRRLVSGGDDSMVRLWDCTSWEELLVLEGHLRDVHSVAFSPCGGRVASASRDSTVRLWDSLTGENRFVLRGHNMGVESVTFSPDGLQIVSGGYDKTIRVWDLETGEPKVVLSPTFREVYSTTFSPDGRWIASGHKDGVARLWDAVSGEQGPVLCGHASVVTGLAFSPNSQRIASSSNDHSVRLWDASTGALVSVLTGHNTAVWSVAFSPDGLQLASAGDDNKVRLWEVNSNWSGVELQGPPGSVWKAAYAFDGHVILSHNDGSTVRQWNATTGAPLPVTIKFPGSLCVEAVAFSPDGKQIATGGDDCVIRLWDRQTGTAGLILEKHQERFTNIIYSPCGRWLVAASWNNTIRLWDLHDINTERPQAIAQIDEKHDAAICSISFSSAGRQLAIGSVSGHVQLFDLRSGKLAMSKKLTKGIPRTLTFSPDGQHLAIGSSDSSIYLLDVNRSEVVVVGEEEEGEEGLGTKLDGHRGEIFSVAYSPCGQWIASGSGDRTARLWHRQQVGVVETWLCVTTIRSFFNIVYSVAWNPIVPMEFVTACLDGTMRVWRKSGGSGDEDVVYGLLWGTNTRMLCTEGLVLKNATGLSPIHRKLLVQRGAVDYVQVPAEDGSDMEE
ncbi:hypothetical protein BGZ47_001328 [Haplosporangium gracile]|nr:hypothetical protein BGZ47_001328 [Haplosporangium gracile]